MADFPAVIGWLLAAFGPRFLDLPEIRAIRARYDSKEINGLQAYAEALTVANRLPSPQGPWWDPDAPQVATYVPPHRGKRA